MREPFSISGEDLCPNHGLAKINIKQTYRIVIPAGETDDKVLPPHGVWINEANYFVKSIE